MAILMVIEQQRAMILKRRIHPCMAKDARKSRGAHLFGIGPRLN